MFRNYQIWKWETALDAWIRTANVEASDCINSKEQALSKIDPSAVPNPDKPFIYDGDTGRYQVLYREEEFK